MSDPDADLLRVRLDLAYDGTAFSGWTAQPCRRTVEGELSRALTTVLRAGEPVRLTVAGRTDAGVHARGQVAHADVDASAWRALPGRSDRSPEQAALSRLAGVLAPDVVVRAVQRAPAGFDARFAATSRRYLYRLCDRPARLDPLRRFDTVVTRTPLDAAAMDVAARELLGLRDFAAFCKRREGATTVRTLLEYSWRRLDDGVLAATVVADAFCHSMVRSLVGAVVPVGQGRRPVTWPAEVLAAGARDGAVAVMPAHGLSLEEVTYPPDAELAGRVQQARAVRTLPEA
ncbi:MAG TPA: tRNA pseudouridine(38-40) synthase TruA [Angustibacter sp.]|nr:tRNA pseudouridine(38-40) synthase TruA [Angustibacter sp.]